MGFFNQKGGFVSQPTLWAAIAKDLSAHGMDVISVDGVAGGPISDSINTVVLQATASVDPLATEQPWRLCIKAAANSVRLYAATPTQISDLGAVTKVAQIQYGTYSSGKKLSILSGTIGNYAPEQISNKATQIPVDLVDRFFYHKGAIDGSSSTGELYANGSMQFEGGAGPASLFYVDDAAMPFSYMVSISDHGIAVGTSVESRDNEGCRNNWFCIQRPIDPDTRQVVTGGAAPLFCLYSCAGGGSEDANSIWAGGIMRFTVREKDINAPAFPTSAVIHTADSFCVMNPLQQVTFNENGRYDFRFPAGLNTHRTSYPYEIDMVGYGSADVSSHKVGIELQVYKETDANGDPKMRKYRAFAANCPNNTGMRLFFLEEGGGV